MSNSNGQSEQQSGGKKPAQVFRYGAIKATIWRNDGRNGTFFNTVITRGYKPEGDDQWRDSSSFGQEDLPTVAKAALDAHSWVQEELAKARAEARPQGPKSPQPRQRPQARQPAGV